MVRTEALISTVKGWNAKPSFVEGVRRACKAVGLRPPPGKLLSTRHPLLHVGELRPPGATSDEYWIELDAMVLKLILRLLKYDGLAYWHALGPHPVKLRDYLEADMGDK